MQEHNPVTPHGGVRPDVEVDVPSSVQRAGAQKLGPKLHQPRRPWLSGMSAWMLLMALLVAAIVFMLLAPMRRDTVDEMRERGQIPAPVER